MRIALAFAALAALGAPAGAQVGITADLAAVTVQTAAGPVEIARIQDTAHELSGDWARTSRPCPDFCIQPMVAAEGVTTIGELELLALLTDGETVVVDSRTPEWFQGGTIPGAVSMPYTEMRDHLGALGCEIDFDGWDCAAARPVALFCNGAWCGQSSVAIRVMLAAGYPAGRIHWYRAGMQGWRMLGLTVVGGAPG